MEWQLRILNSRLIKTAWIGLWAVVLNISASPALSIELLSAPKHKHVIMGVSKDGPWNATTQWQGYVTLPNGQTVWVDYIPPTTPNKLVWMDVNGLTWNTTNWNLLTSLVTRWRGEGVLRWDMRGQGMTRELSGEITEPIPYQKQAEDAALIVQGMKLQRPPIMVALSYGGAPALELAITKPHLFEHFYPVSGYSRPVSSQVKLFDFIIGSRKLVQTLVTGKRISKAEYDEASRQLMKELAYNYYPIIEPGPWKPDGIYNMTLGVWEQDFIQDPRLAQIPEGKVSILSGLLDIHLPQEDFVALEKALGPALRKHIQLLAPHKAPEEAALLVFTAIANDVDARERERQSGKSRLERIEDSRFESPRKSAKTPLLPIAVPHDDCEGVFLF